MPVGSCAVRVSGIAKVEVDEGIEWRATVQVADESHELRFGAPAELASHADASMFVAACFRPAMAWGQDLEIDGPVSAHLLARLPILGRHYSTMDPGLRPPEVTAAEAVDDPEPTGHGTACLLSRGVDSTYSVAVDRVEPAPLDHLLYCRTLEPHHDPEVSDAELAATRRVADRVGLPLHVAWTNLRTFTDPMFGWSAMHGAGLSALGLLVRQRFDTLVIPSAYDLPGTTSTGSHPSLDPLWSTADFRIFHDLTDRGRHAKVAWLAEHRPELLAELKVCYSDNASANCGQCHKCLLTMSSLRAAGALHLAPLFPSELDLEALRRQRLPGLGRRGLWLPILFAAREVGDDDLAAAIEDVFRLTAVPTLRELVGGRSRSLDRLLGRVAGPARFAPYDPERATTFETFDRVATDRLLPMVRHGEVPPPGQPPRPGLRPSTVVASIEASLRHRRR
ncbi:MAG: hypothetical protein R2701_03935 [Acidimicrobiales bacterium]